MGRMIINYGSYILTDTVDGLRIADGSPGVIMLVSNPTDDAGTISLIYHGLVVAAFLINSGSALVISGFVFESIVPSVSGLVVSYSVFNEAVNVAVANGGTVPVGTITAIAAQPK
jgi:hypothetical protein